MTSENGLSPQQPKCWDDNTNCYKLLLFVMPVEDIGEPVSPQLRMILR